MLTQRTRLHQLQPDRPRPRALHQRRRPAPRPLRLGLRISHRRNLLRPLGKEPRHQVRTVVRQVQHGRRREGDGRSRGRGQTRRGRAEADERQEDSGREEERRHVAEPVLLDLHVRVSLSTTRAKERLYSSGFPRLSASRIWLTRYTRSTTGLPKAALTLHGRCSTAFKVSSCGALSLAHRSRFAPSGLDQPERV